MSGKQHLKTSYDEDPLMYGFFIGCVRWALADDDVMLEYRKQTGDTYKITRQGRTFGGDLAFFQRFSDWIEVNLFGTPEYVYVREDAE